MEESGNHSESKRKFLKYGLVGIGGMTLGANAAKAAIENIVNTEKTNNMENVPAQVWKWSTEARYYEQTARGAKCNLCPNSCNFKQQGDKGLCRVKVFENGKLWSTAYGNPCTTNIDPIEKKPLYHFLPASRAYSIATAGCTFACLNCQNWDISQVSPEQTHNLDMMPAKVVENALATASKNIAYTYAEPLSFYEYTYDTAKIARSKGIKNLLISNGYCNEKPMRDIAQYMDAANINLKSFTEEIYSKLNGGNLKSILTALKILKEMNVWLEITNLIVPSWTDDMDMVKKMCDWLVENGFRDYPLHFNRFYPMYKLINLPDTPVVVLEKARNIALASGMKYVYIGNVPGHIGSNTYCPKCKKMIVERMGFTIVKNDIQKGHCKYCQEKIAGVWG